MLDDLDVYAEAGGRMIAYSETVTVDVSDGELNVDFQNVVSYANIRGFEITEVEPGTDNTAPVITLLGGAEMTVALGGHIHRSGCDRQRQR